MIEPLVKFGDLRPAVMCALIWAITLRCICIEGVLSLLRFGNRIIKIFVGEESRSSMALTVLKEEGERSGVPSSTEKNFHSS